jgi:azurin
MAKLTNKQRQALEVTLDHLTRSLAFVMQQNMVLARVRDQATTTLDFVRPSDGAVLTPTNKEIGSDFAMAHTALYELQSFLANN